MNGEAISERRGPNYYAGDLRRDLLDGALQVIAREGPGALSLRSVARQLGVSHAAPANHFADKTALFTAIAAEGFRLLTAELTEAASPAPAVNALERFRAAGMAYMHFALEHTAHFAVMWRTDLVDSMDEELSQAKGAAFGALLDAIRAAQSDGWAEDVDSQDLAYLAWSTVHGLASLWIAGAIREGEERPFDVLAQDLLTLFAGGLASHRRQIQSQMEGDHS